MNKFSRIIKFRFNKAIFFVLVTAMLSMQWSTTHIHLAEHHDHDGNHHQHNIETHAHQSFVQNDSFVDSTHQTDEHKANVVELDNDCNIHKWNSHGEQPLVLTSATIKLNFTPQLGIIENLKLKKSKHRYIDYSTILLRAPPQLS